jgi:hypothetical protein
MIVYGTQTPAFKDWRRTQRQGVFNGAYFYSKEIEDNILPRIDADLFVVTVGASIYQPDDIPDGAVVVCHENRTPAINYNHLFRKGILWVCSKQSTADTMRSYGEKAAYVPLSIDTEYVRTFAAEKTKEVAFVGNKWGFKADYLANLPSDIDQLSDLPREDLLREMAKYKRVIAEGRCLMEAQVLGAEGEVPKYKNLEAVFVKPLDNRDAIPYWQEALVGHARTGTIFLKCLTTFHDLKSDTVRRAGGVFAVLDERAAELLGNKLNLVERV